VNAFKHEKKKKQYCFENLQKKNKLNRHGDLDSFKTIDAQSFSNSFEGVHGAVRKSRGGILFSCFIAFL
jgi:hypothetical protein